MQPTYHPPAEVLAAGSQLDCREVSDNYIFRGLHDRVSRGKGSVAAYKVSVTPMCKAQVQSEVEPEGHIKIASSDQ